MVNKNWFSKILPAKQFPEYQKGFNEFIESSRKSRTVTAPVICKNRTQKIVSWKTSKVFVDKTFVGTVAIGKDVTEITQKVDLLQESEVRFKTLAELVQIPLSFISLNGDITFVNKAYTKEYGFQLEEIPNVKTLINLCYKNKNDRAAAFEVWKQELAKLKIDKKILFQRATIFTKFGEKKIIEYSAVLRQNYIYYSYLDITAYIENEFLLLQSRENFKKIAENTPVAIVGADALTMKVVFANNLFVEVLGYTQSDINAMEDWGDIIVYSDEDDEKKSLEDWENVKAELFTNNKASIKILERKILCKNGKIKTFEVAITYDSNTIYALFYDITERKLAEKLLKESEEKFRTLAELLPMPISTKTIDDKIIFLNNAYIQQFGYTLKDIPDFKAWLKKAYRIEKSRIEAYTLWKQDVASLRKGEKTPVRTLEVYNKKGEKRFLSHTTTISGNFIYCAYTDITEQREFERKLNESEQRFRNIVENLPIPLVSINPVTGVLIANKKHQSLIGHNNSSINNSKDLTKFSIDDLVDENSRKHFLNLLKKVKNNKIDGQLTEPTYKVEIFCKDKITRTFEITESIFGNTLYTLFHDITEQLKATELLKVSEQKFRVLAENMPVAIGAYDDSGKTIFVNKHFTTTTGYKIKDVPSIREWYNQTQPNATKRLEFYNYWNTTVENYKNGVIKQRPEIKASSRCKDGSFKYFTYSFSVFDKTTYILLIDITEEEKAKKQLEKSHQELRVLASYLQNIREEERKNISREIHDELGQQITGIKMDVSSIFKKTRPLDEYEETKRKEIIDALNTSIKSVRKIATQLRPSILDDLGVIATFEWLIQDFKKRTGIECIFYNNINENQISIDVKNNLFRILQESLTNVMRHAFATTVNIDLFIVENKIKLIIADNGKGFNQNSPKATLGIIGMRERTSILNGSFAVVAEKMKGTKIIISIPIKK